jgi:hypothetical protein
VTEQIGGPLNSGKVADDFATEIMLGETLFDVRFFKQPCHETLLDRIPSRGLATVFLEIAFALRVQKSHGEKSMD